MLAYFQNSFNILFNGDPKENDNRSTELGFRSHCLNDGWFSSCVVIVLLKFVFSTLSWNEYSAFSVDIIALLDDLVTRKKYIRTQCTGSERL